MTDIHFFFFFVWWILRLRQSSLPHEQRPSLNRLWPMPSGALSFGGLRALNTEHLVGCISLAYISNTLNDISGGYIKQFLFNKVSETEDLKLHWPHFEYVRLFVFCRKNDWLRLRREVLVAATVEFACYAAKMEALSVPEAFVPAYMTS